MLAQAPPYHGRISETLARYAVIRAHKGYWSLPHSTPPAQSHTQPTPPGTPGTPNTAWLVHPYPFVARPALLLHSLAAAVARWTFFFCFLPLDAPPPMWLFPPSLGPHHPSRHHTPSLALPSARTPTCNLRPILHRTPSVVAASFGKQVCPSVWP